MKEIIEKLLLTALSRLQNDGLIPADIELASPQVTRTKDASHGDFASNIALVMSKPSKQPPRKLAEAISKALEAHDQLSRVEIAGPGFINFFVSQQASRSVIAEIIEQGAAFGKNEIGQNQTVLIEYVSANPTGPLHVGHGRGAAYGQALSDLLSASGFEVTREYYVNDAGRQIDILAVSIWLRYLQHWHPDLKLPANAYQGHYIVDIADKIKSQYAEQFLIDQEQLLAGLPADEPEGGDKEIFIDALIERAKQLLGEAYQTICESGLNDILADICDDLHEFGVNYQNWFSELSLAKQNSIDTAIEQLRQSGHVYTKDGALWFKSTDFGDEKDRVILRDNGQATYFASDIAYHLDKLNRGYDRIINIWGADHHGYIARVRAALKALSGSDDKLDVLLVQFASLYRGQEKIPMSTRSGSFVSLRELRHEVGNDAARFFYIMRRCEQHVDFDLELAKSQSQDNPVYYIQYAHARICSVFRQLQSGALDFSIELGLQHLEELNTSHEQELIKTLSRYPDMLKNAALSAEPHQITYYLRELANKLHSYYNAHQFLVENAKVRHARLLLIRATQQVLKNALTIIGLSAPENM